MTNTFFDRNTVSNWGELYPQRQGLAKIRSKRAYSHSELKIDPSKFQHRQVFDSKIYEKVNFFRLGFKQLRDKNEKQQKSYHSATLKQLLNELSVNLNEKSFLNFNANYSNYWSLIEDSSEKQKVVEIMTETINNLLKKIIQKIGQLNKAKHQIEQSMLRTQVDLKLIRKQQIRIPENQLKLSDRNQEKQKKMHQKLKVLDFELKKEMLKSQQLEQRLIGQGHEVQQLKKENKQLLNQKQKERSYKQTMQFKVKRLKQQLQVANIIKQQNLTDKMKYIMNW